MCVQMALAEPAAQVSICMPVGLDSGMSLLSHFDSHSFLTLLVTGIGFCLVLSLDLEDLLIYLFLLTSLFVWLFFVFFVYYKPLVLLTVGLSDLQVSNITLSQLMGCGFLDCSHLPGHQLHPMN